jgi:antitoxin component YwqK of YwqJK toxin-antitoxin module
MKAKPFEIINGYVIKYHANGKTIWSKGKEINGVPEGYYEWYRIDGSLKRSGYFKQGVPVGQWITYLKDGTIYKTTQYK